MRGIAVARRRRRRPEWRLKLALGILLVGLVWPVLGPWIRSLPIGGVPAA